MEREVLDGASRIHRTVLIISSASDAHIPFVTEKLESLGVDVFRLNTESLGAYTTASIWFKHPLLSPDGCSIRLVDGRQISSEAVTAVWYRRPKAPDLSSFHLSSEGLAFAHDEWRATLNGLYSVLEGALWVSRPDRIRVGENKTLQLRLARELGFNIPRTLITNDPAAAREFWHNLNGAVIGKPIGLGWVYVQNAGEMEWVRSVMTNEIDEDDLEDLGNLRVAPAVLQEAVPKAYELRVNVVGCKVLAVKIESQKSKISRVDWRRYDLANTPYTPYELPNDLEVRCRQLVAQLGLQFGAIDLIRRPDGEYVFLEINCNGQFAWIEELTEVSVSEALAHLLAGLAPPLGSATRQVLEEKEVRDRRH